MEKLPSEMALEGSQEESSGANILLASTKPFSAVEVLKNQENTWLAWTQVRKLKANGGRLVIVFQVILLDWLLTPVSCSSWIPSDVQQLVNTPTPLLFNDHLDGTDQILGGW